MRLRSLRPRPGRAATILASLVLSGSCAAPPPAEPTSTSVSLPAPAATPPPPPAPRGPCAGRPRCEQTARHAAGTSAAGHAMFVVELSLGPRDPDDAAGLRNCEQREVWLVHEGPGAPPPRALLELCNDGYGASGVGEDELAVAPNRLAHTRMGGSSWRWSTTTTARLDPPAVVELASTGWWAVSQSHEAQSRMDLESLQGFARKELPRCDARGQLPDAGEEEGSSFGSQPIPALPLPTVVALGPIAEAASHDLVDCGARALGDPAHPLDVGLVAVIDATTGALLVQIHDDRPTAGDRVTVWASPRSMSHGTHCWSSSPVTPIEIDLDGRVVAGGQAHPGVVAEAAPGPGGTWRLVRVALGETPQALTVKVTDADPGERPMAIATADTEALRGELVALGSVWPLDETRVRCELEGRRLVTKLAAAPDDPSKPLLGDGF